MIKVVNLVSILVAPLAIRNIGGGTRPPISPVCLEALGASVAFFKRGSTAEKRTV